MESNRELIWFIPKWPLPADDGARVASALLLKDLSDLGVRVHLCPIVTDDDATDTDAAIAQLGVASVCRISRKRRSLSRRILSAGLRPWVPITYAPYCSRGIAKQARAAIAARPRAAVVFDGLHAGAWSSRSSPDRTQIYRAHNVEARLWKRAASTRRNPVLRVLLGIQALLVSRWERGMVGRADLTFPVSETDALFFRRGRASAQVHALPIGFPVNRSDSRRVRRSRELLFVGRLDWAPNREGLQWFLREVWPELSHRAPDLSLTVVGSGDGSWMKSFLRVPGIRFEGRVESTAPYYDRALASIAPVFFGSGTRVKIIESAMNRCPSVSTAIGAEGVGLEPGFSYFRAESAGDWVRSLATLSPEAAETVGERAYEYASRTYDSRKVAAQFHDHVFPSFGLATGSELGYF